MTSNLTIVQAVRNFGVGEGVGSVAENLEREFRRRGIRCERVTLRSSGLKRRRSDNLAVAKLLQMREVVWFSLVGTAIVSRWQRRPNVVVITHGDPVAGDIYVNHGILKKVMRDRHPGRFDLPRNPMHWFTLLRDEWRYGSKRAHRVVVSLTEADSELLRELYPRLALSQRVINNGIDFDHFDLAPPEVGQRVRRSLDIPTSARVGIFVGHEYERKGLWPTVEALRLLPEDFHLIVVGGSEHLVATAREATPDLRDRLHLVGTQTDTRPFLAAANFFVLPTAYETGPLVMLEALASGLPTAVTATGLALEVINDGTNGVIVDTSPENIARGLRRVDRIARTAGSDLLCRQSISHLAWAGIADQYLDLVSQVADGSLP